MTMILSTVLGLSSPVVATENICLLFKIVWYNTFMIEHIEREIVAEELGRGCFGVVYATKLQDLVLKVSWAARDRYRAYLRWLEENNSPSSARPRLYPVTASEQLIAFITERATSKVNNPAFYLVERLVPARVIFRHEHDDIDYFDNLIYRITNQIKVSDHFRYQFVDMCTKFRIMNGEAAFDLLRQLFDANLSNDVSMGNIMFRKVTDGWELVVTDPAS